jgi:outer membrane usher protein FimD/PapC
MKGIRSFRYHRLTAFILAALVGAQPAVYAVEFNTDILDTEDKGNIDLSRFSEMSYIMPGNYTLSMKVNEHSVKDGDFTFYERPEKQAATAKNAPVEACISAEQITFLGLKPDAVEKLSWWHDGQCADIGELAGVTTRGDLSESSLMISVPQAFLEYQDSSWLPPARWEDGEPGLLFDYNLSANLTKPNQGQQSQNVSGTGTAGANLGAWRLRGDWQSSYYHTTGNKDGTQQNFDWSRVYAYRPLRSLSAKLTVGEDYLMSDLFDSWRFTGASVVSDESMLPPRLRGYAPEVTGIARTNAKVIISQQGRVIYQTTVASGPFRIQDLSDALSGKLDVRVEEQDGSTQEFQVDTATIPYLTRAGQLRYKIAAGRPSDYSHHVQGPMFGTGEFSWGVSNAWSLYGGAIAAGDYNSLALGIGRDLLDFGAISADVTQSVAKLPDDSNKQGKSWRLSYSKRFDELNSEITFAGYRFSERDYMSMGEYLDARYNGARVGRDKELYTVTASKSFTDLRMSAYLSYSHQTYWDRDDSDRYSVSVSRYFDIGDFHNLSASLSATRTEYNGRQDDTAYLSLSMPFGNGSVSYNGTLNNGNYSQTAGYYQRLENDDSYRVQAGTRNSNGESMTTQASGYYTHSGDLADMSANVGWEQNSYTSLGLTLAGGATATPKGAALHPGGVRGGTRMMVSTDGVAGVPIDRNEKTNAFGIAVVPGVPSYYRNSTSIDVNKLPDDVEAAGNPVAESALTEGAIGYRSFEVLKGAKAIAILNMTDGSHPPFGASVRNAKDRELGIVSDGGLTWLSGISPNEELTVKWGTSGECKTQIPAIIPAAQLLLPCQ